MDSGLLPKPKKWVKKFFGFLFDCLDQWLIQDAEERVKKLQEEFFESTDPVRRRRIVVELQMQEAALNCIQERVNRREYSAQQAMPSSV